MGKMSDLEITIREAAEHYYKGNPILTDIEFDKLLDELKESIPEHPILKAVGFGYMPEPGELKVGHIGDTVGSLAKVKIADINKDRQLFDDDFVSMPKLDGSSIVAHYRHGLLDVILTRGNGEYGIDVTKNLYPNLPYKIDNYGHELLIIRNEAVLTYEDFEGMEGSNPRNKCAGMIQSKNSYSREELDKITIIPYSIIVCEKIHDPFIETKTGQLEYLKENGFHAIPYLNVSFNDIYDNILNKDYAPESFQKLENGKTFPIDGVVMVNNKIVAQPFQHDSSDPFQYYSLNPSSSLAFKYADETVRTVVEDINWQMSNGSKFIPVLKIKEVNIDGVKINNVTSNNYQWLKDRKCGIGAEIEVKRANEVIPNMHMVIKESEEYDAPCHCPACESLLGINGVDIVCINEECPQKVIGLIYKIWEYIKPDGASDACFDIFLNEYVMLNDGDDLFDKMSNLLKSNCIVGNSNHYHQLIQKAIDRFKTFNVDLPDIIKMSNISTLGMRIGKKIKGTIDFKSFIDVIKSNGKFSSEVFKFAVMNDNINRGKLKLLIQLWDNKFILEEDKNNIMDEYRIAATGVMSIPRSKWFKEMAKYGVEKVSVGKNCQYLVCNEKSDSSSYKKAEKLNIPIVSEGEFLKDVLKIVS